MLVPSVPTNRNEYVLAIVLVCWSTFAVGGDWRLLPRFSIDQTVTDNVNQSGTDATSDFITELRPGFSLRGSGARISSNIDYNFQDARFLKNSTLDSRNHQLQGDTSIELVRDHVTVESNSSISQQLLDSQGIVTRNNLNRNGNRGDVTRFQVGPVVRYQFGTWASMRYNFSYDSVKFKDRRGENAGQNFGANFGTANNSEEFTHNLSVSSGNRITRFPLAFNYQTRRNELASGQVDSFESLSGDVSYVFSRKFRATFTIGEDRNDFRTSQRNQGGFYWRAGGMWNPTQRTSVSGNYGERFFGNTFNINANHRHRRWNFGLNYSEEISTNNQAQRNVTLVPLADDVGNSIFDPFASGNFRVPLDTPTLRSEAFVSKRLGTNLSYQMRRSSVRFEYSESSREFQLSDIEELIRVLGLGFQHRISPRTSFNLDANWRQASQGSGNAGNLYSISASTRYSLGPHTNLRIAYSYDDQSGITNLGGFGLGGLGSGRNGGAFSEHSLVAGLLFNF